MFVSESLFKGIEWGTSKVFEQQVEAAEFLGMKAAKLDQMLRDVDTPEDIGIFEQGLGVRTKEVTAPMWSIIIPCLNEMDEIENCLQNAIQVIINKGLLVAYDIKYSIKTQTSLWTLLAR
jgi:hypothetical protein